MSSWNTIARSKRVEWRRKDERLGWLEEQHFASMRRWLIERVSTVTLHLDTSRWDAAFGKAPAGAVAGPLGLGHLMRAALRSDAQPEGPPYTHTYTPGHPWDWEYLPGPENDE